MQSVRADQLQIGDILREGSTVMRINRSLNAVHIVFTNGDIKWANIFDNAEPVIVISQVKRKH